MGSSAVYDGVRIRVTSGPVTTRADSRMMVSEASLRGLCHWGDDGGRSGCHATRQWVESRQSRHLCCVRSWPRWLGRLWTPHQPSVRASGTCPTEGDDAADCLSVATTCVTIGAAIGKAGSGDQVLVVAGFYIDEEHPLVVDRDVTITGGWDPFFEKQEDRSALCRPTSHADPCGHLAHRFEVAGQALRIEDLESRVI